MAYNPYFPNYQPNYTPQIQSQVIKVRGEQSARSINLAPNGSILLMDETAPIVWLCTTDGVGSVTATPYDISLHHESPPVNLTDLESRIKKIESELEVLHESHDKSVKRPVEYTENKADVRNAQIHAEPAVYAPTTNEGQSAIQTGNGYSEPIR